MSHNMVSSAVSANDDYDHSSNYPASSPQRVGGGKHPPVSAQRVGGVCWSDERSNYVTGATPRSKQEVVTTITPGTVTANFVDVE